MMMKISLLLALFVVFVASASAETQAKGVITSKKEEQNNSNQLGRKVNVGVGGNYNANELSATNNKEAKENNDNGEELKRHEDQDKNDAYDKYGHDDSSSDSHHYYKSKNTGSGDSGTDAYGNESSRN